MTRPFKLFLAPFWLPLLWIAGAGFWRLAASAPPAGRRELYFLGGLLVYFLLLLLARDRGRSFAHTFEHELTHLVVGVLFFKSPSQFKVGKQDGETYLSGSNFVISLAPYFLPLWAMIPLLLLPLLNPAGTFAALAALGFLYGLHLYSTIHEFGFYQPDVREHGRLFSLLCVAALNVLILGIIIGAVAGGYPGIAAYFRHCAAAAVDVWHEAMHRI
jgi:hypothetical protein